MFNDLCVFVPAAGVREAEGAHAHPRFQPGEGEGGWSAHMLLGSNQ